jgi:hypothetical protein
MVRILGGLWNLGIVEALLAQYLFYLLNRLLIHRLALQDGLLVQHVQWPDDRLPAVIARLSLLHDYARLGSGTTFLIFLLDDSEAL